MLIPGGAAAPILLQYMACSTNWLSRHPLKVEVTGSSPVQVTILATMLYALELWPKLQICTPYVAFFPTMIVTVLYICAGKNANIWVGSPAARAADCKSATLETTKVRVLPGPP